MWLATADLSDHGPVLALQVCLGQWPSFTGMEHGAPHARLCYNQIHVIIRYFIKGLHCIYKPPEHLVNINNFSTTEPYYR